MKHLSRVLVAVDYSKPARAAFDRALALSRAHAARLTLVHAVPADERFGTHARERRRLVAELRQVAAASDVPLSVRVQHGDPAGVILLHADAIRADLIVVGTDQRTGLDRLRAGSVAERVLLKAAQPVLVVPARDQSKAAAPFSSIAVAVDFGDATAPAIEQALALADGANGRVTLVHVTPGSAPTDIPRHHYRFGVVEYQQLLRDEARRRLRDLAPASAGRGSAIATRVVSGAPAEQIARVAREIDADAIVVGVSARGVMSRTVFGATAARLLRLADRPVLAVPERLSRAGGGLQHLAA